MFVAPKARLVAIDPKSFDKPVSEDEAAQLREAGVMAELDYRRRSLRAQIKQADRGGFRSRSYR